MIQFGTVVFLATSVIELSQENKACDCHFGWKNSTVDIIFVNLKMDFMTEHQSNSYCNVVLVFIGIKNVLSQKRSAVPKNFLVMIHTLCRLFSMFGTAKNKHF